MMTTQQVADQLVRYCRDGKYEQCYAELYAPNCVSIEPAGAMLERAEGMEQIAEKGRKWGEMVEEMHDSSVSDPIVAGNNFSCTMSLDVTMKGMGRNKMDEVCVYQVKDGKVVLEQFFYPIEG